MFMPLIYIQQQFTMAHVCQVPKSFVLRQVNNDILLDELFLKIIKTITFFIKDKNTVLRLSQLHILES